MTLKTELIAILDGSGSMEHLVDETIGGYNSFIDKQKAIPGECRVTLVIFDSFSIPGDKGHGYKLVYQGVPIAEVPRLTREVYYAFGGTPLLDTIGKTLNDQGQRIATDKWAEKVMVMITTDGHENASKEYTRERVKAMIEHAEKAGGWEFLYMSASPTAFADSASIGLGASKTAKYAHTGVGTQSLYSAMSAASATLRGGGAVGQSLAAMKNAAGELDEAALNAQLAAQSQQGANVPKAPLVPPAARTPGSAGTGAPASGR